MAVQPPREPENWFDAAFVSDWLDRQAARTNERQRQFAMIRALMPHEAGASFRYLNFGAGDGWLDEGLLTKFTNCEATLLDGSQVMLDRAQERLNKFGERARYVLADLSSPEWVGTCTGPFDTAVSTIALHNLEDPGRLRLLYREMATLIADGGCFLNLDYVRAPSPALGAVYRFASADPESGFMPVRGYRDFAATVDEHLGWLREAGFTLTDCFWREFRLALYGGFKGTPRVPSPA